MQEIIMKYVIQFFLVIPLLLSGCSSSAITSKELKQARNDVYRALASPYCNDGTVYIDPKLTSYTLAKKEIDHIRSELSNISQETLESFILANNQIEQLSEFSDFPIECDYQFTSHDTPVWCNESHCITPIGFSPIGFNTSVTQAMVYMYWECSECGGWGRIYFLEKSENSWAIVHYVQLWIS
jgi:hypothetical protein